jgi:hypothetical protein
MIDILQKYLIIEEWERELTDAIHNRQRITLHYKGYQGELDPKTGKRHGRQSDFTVATPPGMRVVLPVALGLDKRTGAMVVRAYQEGGTQTAGRHGDTPEPWKYFRVDRITRVIPREGENDLNREIPPGYKRNDQLMSVHYAQIDDPETGAVQEPMPAQGEIQAQPVPKNKLDKIPDNAKVVLKPEEPVAPPAPTAKAKPTAKPPIPPVEKPEPVEPVQPTPEEPETNEPEELTREIKEWVNRLNKVI